MPSAQAVLTPYKNLKHPKIKIELDAVMQAWTTLQEFAQRDETLNKMATKVAEKNAQISELVR